MKKNSSFSSVVFLGVAGLIYLAAPRVLRAEDLDAPPVTQVQMQEALNKIEEHLTVIEENQKKILEGQDKLSEEHTQLRYWIHKK